jgi:hypothetical protein
VQHGIEDKKGMNHLLQLKDIIQWREENDENPNSKEEFAIEELKKIPQGDIAEFIAQLAKDLAVHVTEWDIQEFVKVAGRNKVVEVWATLRIFPQSELDRFRNDQVECKRRSLACIKLFIRVVGIDRNTKGPNVIRSLPQGPSTYFECCPG